jgi:hypothetical protein
LGQWQRQLNKLGGVKPLAFGQYGELGPGFEQLQESWTSWRRQEQGADEAAKRYLTPNRVVAKGVQLRLLRQRVVMTAQSKGKRHRRMCSSTAFTTHYRGGTLRRRCAMAQDELHSAAQARKGVG